MKFVDFDIRTYEMIKSYSPEAGEKYKKDYDDRVASLPSITNGPTQQTVVEVKEDTVKEDTVKEEIDQELMDLQEAYKAKFNKNLSPAVKNNKERIRNKLNS